MVAVMMLQGHMESSTLTPFVAPAAGYPYAHQGTKPALIERNLDWSRPAL
jgi:hypothetical protein